MFVGSYGFQVTLTTGLDLTAATALSLVVKKPDETEYTALGPSSELIVLDASAGLVGWVVPDGVLSVAGYYLIQLMDSSTGKGTIGYMESFVVNTPLFEG